MPKGHSKAEAAQRALIDCLCVLTITVHFGDEAVSFFWSSCLENSVVRLVKSNGQSDEIKFIKIAFSMGKIREYIF